MARAPMKLDLKKNQLHKDFGKAPGAKVTEADIAEEKAKGDALLGVIFLGLKGI
jgi:hypothetical protein